LSLGFVQKGNHPNTQPGNKPIKLKALLEMMLYKIQNISLFNFLKKTKDL